MAQMKPEVTKSQMIREFVTKNPTSTIGEVVAALAGQGVEVTKNHVHVVKGKMRAKKRQQRKEKEAAFPSGNGATTKSAAVRSFLKANRKVTAKEVVSALAANGVEVTEGLVYFVKGQMKGKRGRKKKNQALAAVATVAVSTNGDTVKTIMKVKGWASEIGGMKKLKALVEALIE